MWSEGFHVGWRRGMHICYDSLSLPYARTPSGLIWADQPVHSFLVGCLNPCLQGTNVWVVLPQPTWKDLMREQLRLELSIILDTLSVKISRHFMEVALECLEPRITSHTRLRARDEYTSSTLIGGEGRVGPSLLHTTLGGPTEYVNAKWM